MALERTSTDRTAADRTDLSDQIPEADLLDQQVPLDPPVTGDEPGPRHRVDRTAPAVCDELISEADEAARWEQRLSVPAADEDHSRSRSSDDLYAG